MLLKLETSARKTHKHTHTHTHSHSHSHSAILSQDGNNVGVFSRVTEHRMLAPAATPVRRISNSLRGTGGHGDYNQRLSFGAALPSGSDFSIKGREGSFVCRFNPNVITSVITHDPD